MDIYKLNDDVPQKEKRSVGANDSRNALIITDIRQAVKNENRVNVFVDGKYSFSLDIAQVVDSGIKKGQKLTVEKLDEYKKASEYGKLYQRTLEWVLARPRSERETRDYLIRKLKKSSSDTLPVGRVRSSDDIFELSDKIVGTLLAKGYINDESFARYYVENRFTKKGISSKRLRMELMKKGISRDTIDQVLEESDRNDEDEIRKIIAKKRAKYDDEKLIQYLCRQGFQFETVRNLVHEMDSQNSE